MTEPVEIPAEVEALALAVLAKRVRENTDLVKALIGGGYANGDKHTFRSPLDDRKIGTIYRTDPDPVWKVVDPEALHALLRQDPSSEVTEVDIVDHDAAVIVLAEHAPRLLAIRTRVSDDAVKAAVQAAADGEDVPGVAKVQPPGSLTVRPDKGAAAVIADLVQAGVLTWDGRPALPAGGGS